MCVNSTSANHFRLRASANFLITSSHLTLSFETSLTALLRASKLCPFTVSIVVNRSPQSRHFLRLRMPDLVGARVNHDC